MAYVAARRNQRFEIRESLHTPTGPRARTLAGFTILTDDVLDRAAKRATRSFDVDAVIASAERAGAPVRAATVASRRAGDSSRGFVQSSRRMAASLQRTATRSARADPGRELIDLLGFADAVTASQPARPSERLGFPVLSKLVAGGPAAAGAS
jgi:hypothetical protein